MSAAEARPFPSGDDFDLAMLVIEWAATSAEAARIAPQLVLEITTKLSKTLTDAGWRDVLDLSLLAWKVGYDRHRRARLTTLGL